MQIRNVRRWQWIAIGLVLGAAVGWMRNARLPKMSEYERIISARLEFDDALLSEAQGLRRFRNLVVFPAYLKDGGGSRLVHIVAGDYFDGKLETIGGKACARWRRACFVAEAPFQQASGHGTVLNYLDSLGSKGVQYTYAWWRRPLWATALWTGAGVLVIGLIWPTLLNVLIFGTIFRPREATGIDLIRIKPTPPAATCTSNAETSAQVQSMVEALEAEVAAPAEPLHASGIAAPPPASARALSATALDAPAPSAPVDAKSYGKDEDDYYPTEVHHSSNKRE